MSLDPSRFDEWFHALNGQEPFPWQRRLFRECLCPVDYRAARWPSLIQLPTASGKTAIIDLAVLALAAGSPCARRRIVFVVDRRVVVDEATLRAAAIARRLRDARDSPTDPLNEVARSLASLGGDEPLVVAELRGGMPHDDAWARSPAQPAVILSTVDQAGSALLFRAYGGHGPRSWPIHAGLLGRDTLLIIDEAHCANPFCQTARAIAHRWQRFAEQPVGRDLALVRMSATPGEAPDFTLDDQDQLDATLNRRLCASKPAELVPVDAGGNDHRTKLVSEVVEHATSLIRSMSSGVLGIVVNRVADARTIFARLDLDEDSKLLLTGRVRGWERDQLLQRWLPRLRAGFREEIDKPLAVVATQCIEVGANFDFDMLITEVASLDALRQRFGRLNRLGKRKTARAAILATTHQIEMNESGDAVFPDPVYGHALARTWAWLKGHAPGTPESVDFGINALESILPAGEDLSKLCQDIRAAYPLLPAHLDLLAQTSPSPEPSPEVSAFLHGTTRASPDVTVVWRADLPVEHQDVWAERVAVQPPVAGEGCAVPLFELRRWLAGRTGEALLTAEDLGDVEGTAASGEAAGPGRRVLRWRGLDEAAVVDAKDVAPGDTIIVPSMYGGCDRFGWNPASQDPVADIGDAVAHAAGRRPVLRLESLEPVLSQSESAAQAQQAACELRAWAAGDDDAPVPREALNRLANIKDLPEWLQGLARSLANDARPRRVEARGAYAIVGWLGTDDLSTADDRSSYGIDVSLVDHSLGVQKYARRYARAVGLADVVVSDLALAGWLHDIGKADPRFQVWLHGGNEVAAALAQVSLAKSGLNSRDRGAVRRARERAGYPRDARHEAQSLALIADQTQLRTQANDWDLLQHLVVSHHGFGRPFIPVALDQEPVAVELTHGGLQLSSWSDHKLYRLESGAAERYWRLIRRYGWWGLAWLESILRLADQRRSEEEQKRAGGNGQWLSSY